MIRDEELAPLLRAAPWMSEDGREAERYEQVDHAVLGSDALLLVVAAVGGPAAGQRFFVPVRTPDSAGRLEEALGSAEFTIAAVTAAFAGRRLRTARGGVVEFRGASGTAGEVRQLPFAQGWSSNAVSLVEIAGVRHIHKTYRRLDETVHEPELLRLMQGTGRTPRWAGDYTYTDASSGTRHPLGVIYRYAHGDGIDVPLRENLRSMWPRLTDAERPSAVVRSHLRPLEHRLRGAGDFLRGFHRDLATRLGGSAAVRYPVGEALRQASARLAALAKTEVALERTALEAAFSALDAEVAALREQFGRRQAAGTAGPCHGDLHLSHLVCGPERDGDGTWRMNVIDLSTPSLGPGEPGWDAQSPLQDLVAVQRALEYFATDEAAFESAQRLGVDQEETMRGALDGAPGWPHGQRAVLRQVFGAADAWRERVLHLLLGPGVDSPLRRLLYLRRLLHELAYNYAHARPYHAAIDLRHAIGSGTHAPALSPFART
jgi:1-epi-valienol-7-phosphate kinase